MAPSVGDQFRQRKSVLGVVDGGLEQRVETERPRFLAERIPSSHAARNGDGQDSVVRHRLESAAANPIQGHLCRRPAARVQPVELARFRLVDDGEEISAQAIAGGLDDAEHGIGRNGGVHRVTAELEDLRAGPRRERLAGGDDSEAANHHRAGLGSRSGRAFTRLAPRCGGAEHRTSEYQGAPSKERRMNP